MLVAPVCVSRRRRELALPSGSAGRHPCARRREEEGATPGPDRKGRAHAPTPAGQQRAAVTDRRADLVSPVTRRQFREALVGEYLRAIIEMFTDEGFTPGPEPTADVQGNGRRLIQQYYNGIDWTEPAHVQRVLHVFEQIVAEPRCAPEQRRSLAAALGCDGYRMDPETGRIADPVVHLDENALRSLPNSSAIEDNLRRMLAAIDTDPRLAVSAARALVESTAKLVLNERQQTYAAGAKLPALVSAAQKALGLDAKDAGGVGGGGDALRKILSSLTTLTQGLTELRNNVGVDHGRDSVPTWVQPRHARLAGGAAQVWCKWMLETLEDPRAPWRDDGPATPGG